MYLFSLTKNYSKKQIFFSTITIIETNSLQLQQSEMSTYLNNFYSSFPEKEHKSKCHLLKNTNIAPFTPWCWWHVFALTKHIVVYKSSTSKSIYLI